MLTTNRFTGTNNLIPQRIIESMLSIALLTRKYERKTGNNSFRTNNVTLITNVTPVVTVYRGAAVFSARW